MDNSNVMVGTNFFLILKAAVASRRFLISSPINIPEDVLHTTVYGFRSKRLVIDDFEAL